MQQVQPQSTTISSVTTTASTENNACCERATKVALAIFLSLTAFVFLPFGVALVLSAIVTLGAICYNENVPLILFLQRSTSNVEQIPTPRAVQVRKDCVVVRFASKEEANTFVKNAPNNFCASYWTDHDGELRSVEIKPNQSRNLFGSSAHDLDVLVTQLKQLCGKDLTVIDSRTPPHIRAELLLGVVLD